MSSVMLSGKPSSKFWRNMNKKIEPLENIKSNSVKDNFSGLEVIGFARKEDLEAMGRKINEIIEVLNSKKEGK